MNNDFTKGRLSIINELKIYCDKKLERIEHDYGKEKDSHKKATQTGLRRAYLEMKNRLQAKESNSMANDYLKQNP